MMKINQQIKGDLLPYLGQETAFEMLNYYKGVPLVYKGKLTSVGDQLIEMEVEAPDSICLSWNPATIILGEGGALALEARVIAYHLLEGTVELSDLQYTDRGFGERTMIRVEPAEKISVEISTETHSVFGDVMDISLTGIGVRISAFAAYSFQTGDTVKWAFNLEGKKITLSGTILSVFHEKEDLRLAIRFLEEFSTPSGIGRYLTRRRVEILRELQAAYDEAYQDALS